MKLIVALDMATIEENLALARELAGIPLWLKVGMRSFISGGNEFIEALKSIDSNFKIFVDLKLYDIPNTMAEGALSLASLNIDMITIHASGGRDGMSAVVDRLKSVENRPLIFAVTVLTSYEDRTFFEIYGSSIEERIYDFADLAYQCGVDGVVSSVLESRKIKESTSLDFLTLTPGIRPFSESCDDQKRVADIKTASENLSDFIVIGRPIYRAEKKREIVERILGEIERLK